MAIKNLKVYCTSSYRYGDYGYIANDPNGHDFAGNETWIEAGTGNINYKNAIVAHDYVFNISPNVINSIVMYAKTFNRSQVGSSQCESVIDIGTFRTKYAMMSTPQDLQISLPNGSIPSFISSKRVEYRVSQLLQTGSGSLRIYNNMAIEANKPYVIINYNTLDVGNLAIDNTNIDNTINVSWEALNQTEYEMQILQGSSMVYSTIGATVAIKSLAPGTIKADGNTKIRVRATDTTGTYDKVWSDWVEIDVMLTKTIPSISTLEPNNLNKLLSQSILVEFSGSNISSWKYEAIQGAVAKYTTTGTTSRQATIPPNIFITGVVTGRLTATYIPAWATSPSDHRTVVKEVAFTAYGPPPNPTLNLSSIYNTAFPLFNWTASNEQMAWQLKVLDGVIPVIDTGETVNTARQYQHNNPLENNKVYQAQLRIRNQYNLYSSWVSATFQVSYAELAQPTFNIYANHVDACIVLNIYNADDENFYKSQVYRRETGTATWLQIADNLAKNDEFKDFECASGIKYEYKVRALSSELTYTDSDVKTMSVKFSYPRLSIAGTNDFIILDSNFEIGTSYNDGKSYQLYAGLREPKESRSLTNYRVFEVKCSLKYSELNNFMRIINTQGSLFLRDSKGLAVYGTVSLKSKGENVLFSYCSLVFVFTETYYGGAQDVVQPECNEFSIKEW